ncbi:hypothetical protein ETD86_33905 [Nonomuraea turkmeniaca]|uniref:Uncharacterized protein n=1 Tax=Nonomuraea turkmeniaca TaxID=103838 RepID=A0A5S4F6N1_9ACTN|nr:hypothetical protein [Nonomuraea turkmeniaca]TMR12010.1 hypothetical protein ETD86_33905 [Nonomuraea turkmeniaca]
MSCSQTQVGFGLGSFPLGQALEDLAHRRSRTRHAVVWRGSMACHGDRQRLAVCLEVMTPGQLVEVAAARLLSAEADQALARRGP